MVDRRTAGPPQVRAAAPLVGPLPPRVQPGHQAQRRVLGRELPRTRSGAHGRGRLVSGLRGGAEPAREPLVSAVSAAAAARGLRGGRASS